MASQSSSPKYPVVRGLARGLSVLQALNLVQSASVADLAARTGLTRPTVHRILETLKGLGFVDRAHLRDTYRLTERVHSLSDGHSHRDWIVEIGRPMLEALSARIVWPVNIATYEDGAMVLRVNTHRESPLSIFPGVPGTRLPVLKTSVGQVYLAFCPDLERSCILDLLQCDVEEREQHAWRQSIESRLQSVRQMGFAIREGLPDVRTASLALPIRGDNRVLACMNVNWIQTAMPTSRAIDQFLQPLQESVTAVEELYRARAAQMSEALLHPRQPPGAI